MFEYVINPYTYEKKRLQGKVRLEKQKLYPHETKKISGRLIAPSGSWAQNT